MLVVLRFLTHTAIRVIETARNFARHFKMRHLVFTNRNALGTERKNVGALTNGVQRKTKRIGFAQILHLDFIFQSWIAHDTVEGQQHGEQKCQFVNRWHFALQENGGEIGINSHGD